MNPALPILVVVSAAGLLWRRREWGVAWCLLGLVGALLLWPALRLADGIPSPAADLSRLAPWVGQVGSPGVSSLGGNPLSGDPVRGNPVRGNPVLRDITFQIQPWLLHLAREVQQGRLPFWNPYQAGGMTFWGNGQGAPLFPLHVLFALLPPVLGFVVLPWSRFLVAGLGAWALARSLGVGRTAALAAGLIFPLSGMLVGYLLFPMGNALCLVPWVLLAVETLAGRPSARGVGWLALAVGLQALGGHPETVLHTALVAGIYLLARLLPLRRAAGSVWLALAGGGLLGGLLAAAVLLPTVPALLASVRWQAAAGATPPLALLLAQPLRLLLPDLYGNPAIGTWWGPFNHLATAVYVGAASLPLAVAGLVTAWRNPQWRALALVTALAAAGAYHLPLVDPLLNALPLVGRALHHRLLFAVELGLALFAAAGLDALFTSGRAAGTESRRLRRSLLLGWMGVGVGLAIAWWRFAPDWRLHGETDRQLAWTAIVLLLSSLPLAVACVPSLPRLPALAGLLAVLAGDLLAAHSRTNPGLPVGRLYPPTGAVTAMIGRPGRVVALGEELRPNAALAYGLRDVRVDDPLAGGRYASAVAGRTASGLPGTFTPLVRVDDDWLDAQSVRFVLTAPGAPSPVTGPRAGAWKMSYDGADARLYERVPPLALARWAVDDTAAGLDLLASDPGYWRLRWRTPSASRVPATVVIADGYDPGWVATSGGSPVPLVADRRGMVVTLAADQGELELSYRPRGLAAGVWLSLFAAVATLGLLAWPGWRPARAPAAQGQKRSPSPLV